MRPLYLPAALILVLGALLVLPVADARNARHTCYPKGSHTILTTKSTRIFWVGDSDDEPWVVYGCLLRRKRPIRLGSGEFDAYNAGKNPSDYRVWSPYVSITIGDCGRYGDNCSVFTRSVDLRTGRRRVQGWLKDYYGTDVEISSAGTIGGVARGYRGRESVVYRVRTTEVEILDSGPIESIRASATTLYWVKGGQTYAASLL